MSGSQLALFVLLSAAPVFCQQSSPASPDSNSRLRGEQAFTENGCPQCHTVHQHGGTKGPDLSAVGSRLSDEQIRSQILKGGKQMPAFGGILQAAEADDLVAYLHTLRDADKTPKKP